MTQTDSHAEERDQERPHGTAFPFNSQQTQATGEQKRRAVLGAWMKFWGVIRRTLKQGGRTGEAGGAEKENVKTEIVTEHRREFCGPARADHRFELASQGISQVPSEEPVSESGKGCEEHIQVVALFFQQLPERNWLGVNSWHYMSAFVTQVVGKTVFFFPFTFLVSYVGISRKDWKLSQ